MKIDLTKSSKNRECMICQISNFKFVMDSNFKIMYVMNDMI